MFILRGFAPQTGVLLNKPRDFRVFQKIFRFTNRINDFILEKRFFIISVLIFALHKAFFIYFFVNMKFRFFKFLNSNKGGLFRSLFCGEGGGKITRCLKLVRITLET